VAGIRKMKPEAIKALTKLWTSVALNAQVAAAEHVRDCDKCRRLFEIAFEEAELSDHLVVSENVMYPNPFFVMTQILRELRRCPNWPKSI
jgi:predicted anti-sigma-YlaC factor YlaD